MAARSQTEQGFLDLLDAVIRAHYPVIAINTDEEERAQDLIEAVSRRPEHRKKGLYTWSRTAGTVLIFEPTGQSTRQQRKVESHDEQDILAFIQSKQAGLFLLFDYDPYLLPQPNQDFPPLVRLLKETAAKCKGNDCTILCVQSDFPEIRRLGHLVKTLDLPLPDEAGVTLLLDEHLEALGEHPSKPRIDVAGETKTQLVQSLLGLGMDEIENVLAYSAVRHRGIGPEAVSTVLDQKKEVIRRSKALTYSHPEPRSSFGGYAHIVGILERAARTYSPEARAFGLHPARGILLVGPPGVGKDHLKKVASSIFHKPLLDMSFGQVIGEGGGIVGQAAVSVKRALSLVTTVGGILGISEFEKAVGGLASSNRSDGGETSRTISDLLTWMQEQVGVYVFATANDVQHLEPEQFRRGRFDSVVFVDLPSPQDRVAIFGVHLRKRGRDPQRFALDDLAAVTTDFSGAEIEGVVEEALLAAFIGGKKDLSNDDLVLAARATRPTAVVMAERVAALREWAKAHLDAGTLDVLPPVAEDEGARPKRKLALAALES